MDSSSIRLGISGPTTHLAEGAYLELITVKALPYGALDLGLKIL